MVRSPCHRPCRIHSASKDSENVETYVVCFDWRDLGGMATGESETPDIIVVVDTDL